VAQPGPKGSTYGVIWLNGNYDNGATRASGWTIRYVEVVGAGSAGNTLSNSNEHTFYCRNGCNSLLFEHNYLHDSSCDFIDTPYGDTVTFNLNHFARNYSSANCHGQFWLGDGNQNNNYTFSNNLIEDVQGTAYWSVLNGGQATNWNIYNNVIFQSSSGPGVSNGIFVTINSGSYSSNINIIGNTFINGHTDYSGRYSLYCDSNNCTGTITFRNNLLYNIVDDQDGTRPVGAANYPNLVRDHNSFINVPGAVGLANSAGDVVVASGAASPFVNSSAYNFQLTGDSSYVNNGVALGAPFNFDMAGQPRGSDGFWERGAFEFLVGSLPSLPAPKNLRTTSSSGS
jgi:hypothetical protein